MTAILTRWKDHFVRWREWELNPVVVKELRQSVRSWTVIGMLLLFLAVMFCTAISYLVGQSFQVNEEQQLGGRVFSSFIMILTGASVMFIPLYVGVRLAAERQESNLDLLYVTTLTPARIIRGKFLCGAYMAVLFFSACMPFMVFTNLLRGVDLPTVFFILTCLFLVICAAIQVAIFLACLPISKLFKILLALVGALIAFRLVGSLSFFFMEMMISGVGSMLGVPDFWIGFFSVSSVLLAAVLLLYFLSVALISPLSANRALPLRLYVTVIWLLGAALSCYWARKNGDAWAILPWARISFIVLTASLLVVVSNYDQLSLRVRRTIPTRPARRALAFLFYNGAAGGLVWVALLMALTFAGLSLLLRNFVYSSGPLSPMPPEDRLDLEVTTGAVLTYSLAYALTALLIHRKLLGRRSPKLAGILAVLLPSAWALVPYIASFFLNRLSWKMLEENQLGNIFNVFVVRNPAQKQTHLLFAGAWLLIMVVLNARWFIRQAKDFKPLDRRAEPPVISETAPPPMATAK